MFLLLNCFSFDFKMFYLPKSITAANKQQLFGDLMIVRRAAGFRFMVCCLLLVAGCVAGFDCAVV